MDCEDAVAPSNKILARDTIGEALQTLDFGRSERAVRINAVSANDSAGKSIAEEDIKAVLGVDRQVAAYSIRRTRNYFFFPLIFPEIRVLPFLIAS